MFKLLFYELLAPVFIGLKALLVPESEPTFTFISLFGAKTGLAAHPVYCDGL